MCLAIYKPSGKVIPKQNLKNGYRSNPHGAGFSYVDPSRGLVTEKGFFSFRSFWKAFKEVQDKQAVIHFRWATHGVRNDENCHPFEVHKEMVMVHNGIINIPCDLNAKRSDTWHFVERYAKPFEAALPGALHSNDALKKLIGEYVTGSKLVFLSADGRHTIIHEDAGIWDDGVWYSNYGYEPWSNSRWFSDDDYAEDFYHSRGAKGSTYTVDRDGTVTFGGRSSFEEASLLEDEAARADGVIDGKSGREWRRAAQSLAETQEDLPGEINTNAFATLEERFPEIPYRDLPLAAELVACGYSYTEIMGLYEAGGAEWLEQELLGIPESERSVTQSEASASSVEGAAETVSN